MNLKKVIKELLLTIDSLLCPIVVPIVVRIKGVNLLHLSFDDVPFIMNEGGVLIPESFAHYLQNLLNEDISMSLYLWNTTPMQLEKFVSIPSSCQIRIGFHDPFLMNDPQLARRTTDAAVRFHGYKAEKKDILNFIKWGGQYLLCCHDEKRISYDLTAEEQHLLNKRGMLKKTISYVKTDIRLEWPIIPQMLAMRHGNIIVVFAHEWGLPQYAKRLISFIRILRQEKIKIITF